MDEIVHVPYYTIVAYFARFGHMASWMVLSIDITLFVGYAKGGI